MQGTVVSIQIAEKAGGALRSIPEAELVAGKGIAGDRYFREQGGKPARQLTLVECEQVEEFNRRTGMSLDPLQTRRNVVTRGISLNQLVGEEFALGETLVRGIDLCEPCIYLGNLLESELQAPEIVHELTHRAGLRAQIIKGGRIRVGDSIQPIRPAA